MRRNGRVRGSSRRPVHEPAYDLEEARQLIGRDCYYLNGRASAHIFNHGLDAALLVADVFASVEGEDFRKSIPLRNPALPDAYAGVYEVPLEDIDDWYLKFYIDDE